MLRLILGTRGASGFGSASTAEEVTDGIDATALTVVITGGASGIGLETARVLALRKAHVIIAARNMEAANEAKQRILDENRTARVDILKLDLSSLKSVKAFADNFLALNLPLNILMYLTRSSFIDILLDHASVSAIIYEIFNLTRLPCFFFKNKLCENRNNAGVMFCPFQLSEDGIEMQFATNHLGHFYLTNLLLDKMKETEKSTDIEGRIVNLSSVAHLVCPREGIQFHNINDKNSYQDKVAYGQSKLANLLHANELSRRLQEEGANITVNSVHPGLIMTNLMRHSAFLMRILRVFTCLLWKNVPQGAATTCYVALHPSLKGVTGKYFSDCNEYEPNKLARDKVLARNLWDFSNNLINASQKIIDK